MLGVWHLRDVSPLPPGFTREIPVRSPTDVVEKLRFLFEDLAQEQLMVVMLNARNHVQAVDVVTVGTLNSSLGHPREVYRSAVACLASSIILMHNHPSGNPEPSHEDIELTRQIKQAGNILGIPLHDHIIVAGNTYTSLAERGKLLTKAQDIAARALIQPNHFHVLRVTNTSLPSPDKA